VSKVIAITGASAGIGRACALRLARDGAAVVVSARRVDRLQSLVKEIESAGGRALAVPGDVTRPDDMRELIRRAVDTYGRLDVMICNAGIGFHGTIGESTPEVARQLVDINVLGTVYAAHAACEVFRRQGSGHVIAMSSVAGVRGVAGMSVYCATKAAQVGFIEGLRTEFWGTGIHASVVYPTSTKTEFHDAMHQNFGHAVQGKGPRQEADTVADAVAKCIARPRGEVFPYYPAKWLGVLNAIAPTFTDRLMRRFSRRRPHVPSHEQRES